MKTTSQSTAPIIQETVQTTQDHISGLFVDYLNNLRLTALLERLAVLEARKEGADQELAALRISINDLIASNRGGVKGMHGFIGERLQVSFSNSEAILNGEKPIYVLIDDNGMTDYLCGDTLVQQKACISDKVFGLTHVLSHAEKYPVFIEKGGIYQIPSDFYFKYQRFINMPESVALKLRKEDLRAWRAARNFHNSAPDIEVRPMCVSYAEIQAGAVTSTIDRESAKQNQEYEKMKTISKDSCKATVKEGLKAVGVSAVLEGTVNGAISFTEHATQKPVREFDKSDWKDIATDTAKGALKGSIRGGVVYTATNVAHIPAPVATAGVTAAFGVIHDIPEVVDGTISGKEFSGRMAVHCADATVSALCAKLGEKIIPIPVVGPLVGNAVGMFVFGIAKKIIKNSFSDSDTA